MDILRSEIIIHKLNGKTYSYIYDILTYGYIYDILDKESDKCIRLLNGNNMICNNYNIIYYSEHKDDIININDNDYLLEVVLDTEKLYMQNLILSIRTKCRIYYRHLPEHFKNDREIKKIAVENHPYILTYMTDEDKIANDFELIKIAYGYMPEYFKDNREIKKITMKCSPHILNHLTDRDKIENDYELIKIAIDTDFVILKSIDDKFKTLEILKYAISINGCAIKFAPKGLKKNKELCDAAIANNPLAYNYLCREFKLDQRNIEIYNTNSRYRSVLVIDNPKKNKKNKKILKFI